MLPNPEERKRMRAEKAAQRAEKQRKGLRIRLIVAAVVVLLCGALIFVLAKRKPSQDTAEKDPTQSQTTAPAVTEPAKPETTVIHYAAVGDLNVNELTLASGGTGYDYTNAFLDVAHLLADADIASVNFEGNLVGEPYSGSAAPQSLATALQKAGVDLVQMANSYSVMRGTSGLASSLDAVRAAGMEPVGAYPTNEAYRESKGYTIRNVQGIKIAFVAFTKGMTVTKDMTSDKDSMTLPKGSEDCVNVLYTDYDGGYQNLNKAKINTILDAVKKEKPDITVALLHWGSEYNNTVSKSQESIVELLQASGVDAIIGTHSHYVQQMSFDGEKGTFVAYSLGDFFANAVWSKKEEKYYIPSGSEYSVVLDLEITKDNRTGKTKITNFSYTPIFTVSEEGKPLRVVRIREAVEAYKSGYFMKVSQETYEKMTYALERIDARIAGE